MNRISWLATDSGHVLVCLLVFSVGVALVLLHQDVGKEILVGALASLWTAMRLTSNKGDAEK